MLMNMSNLQYLSLQKNVIRELIRLPFLPALQILDLSYNKILYIDETAFEFVSLYHIDLSGNQLYRLTSFTGVPSLKSLNLDNNQLVNIFAEDVGEIPSLETLSIVGNGLGTFPLLPRNRIRLLNLADNNISACELHVIQQYIALDILIISDNRIHCNIRFPATMRRLTIDNNKIERTNETLKYLLSDVEFLSLRKNRISSLGQEINPGPSLLYLDLSRNHLTYIPPFKFSLASSLTTLKLEGNSISTINGYSFFGLARLHHLDLQWNQITSLPADCFSSIRRLSRLYITGNPIHTVAGYVFSSFRQILPIEYLFFSHSNSFGIFQLSLLNRSLSYLIMRNNSVESLVFLHLNQGLNPTTGV
ncbi:leucine-rich repeats and immunoglobulin-like domains protein 2 [Lytechinus variegatus]|uniref:leucine-rich repeats and immunoglobulin-like domains protein 2 n=1 Tax=Lytechinus variegatus TaxID=7654 RepID=UPI001BB22F08|nr:leucine-rich repeats and immunoglobulin-like domains protein 2 [Lytechinus variegatus]